MRRIVMLIIRGYQLLLSPLSPPCCRFLPTCSEYARQAVDRHGPIKGLLLAAWRLLRCQPLCAGGYDPVPEHWPRKPMQTSPGSRPGNANPNTLVS
ncbi:MAG TPA: membrane protein insertion efficiency factor YidD [Desulfonatronum sp.]|nr:membrane protein insertion efficiency factor YidD [Desulfonatronum sp.]